MFKKAEKSVSKTINKTVNVASEAVSFVESLDEETLAKLVLMSAEEVLEFLPESVKNFSDDIVNLLKS